MAFTSPAPRDPAYADVLARASRRRRHRVVVVGVGGLGAALVGVTVWTATLGSAPAPGQVAGDGNEPAAFATFPSHATPPMSDDQAATLPGATVHFNDAGCAWAVARSDADTPSPVVYPIAFESGTQFSVDESGELSAVTPDGIKVSNQSFHRFQRLDSTAGFDTDALCGGQVAPVRVFGFEE